MRRTLLDQVIILHERHLKHLLASSFASYHRRRTHLALGMDSPESRAIEPPECGKVIAGSEVGGLHDHYEHIAA